MWMMLCLLLVAREAECGGVVLETGKEYLMMMEGLANECLERNGTLLEQLFMAVRDDLFEDSTADKIDIIGKDVNATGMNGVIKNSNAKNLETVLC